jgi:hypothetical protein
MDVIGNMHGGKIVVKKYQIGEAMATAGVPVVIGGAGNEGIALGDTTTASVDLVGITMDAQSDLQTAQQSDGSDPERQVSVCVSFPTAKARLSGGATEGTALAEHTVTTASTDGLTITTATEWSSPTFDEGMAWGYSGANAGIARKVTSVSSTAGTLTVALPQDTAVGDTFLRAPFAPTPENQFVQLSTALSEIDCSVAVDTDNNNFRVVEVHHFDKAGDGTTKSFAVIVPFDMLWMAGGSV